MHNFKNRYLYFGLILLLCFSSCKSKKWTIKEYSSTKIAIDSSKDAVADKEYTAYLEPFKQAMDEQMNVVIGQSVKVMPVFRPESLLPNFCTDAYREIASQYLHGNIDICIMNIGGIRTDMPQGDVTIGDIFRIMPFENELIILWLKGDKLEGLCDVFAQVGGEGVSGIHMGMKDGKAVNVLVSGQKIDPEKTYIIATNDYLAGGNDKLVQLAEYVKRDDTGLKLRDALINYIKEQTKQGKKLDAQIEGRMYFQN